MNQSSKKRMKLTIQDITGIGVMVATMTASKYCLSFIPNVEPISLLIILYTLFFGPKVLFAIMAFVLIEGVLYGFGIWWVMYLYAWPFLALLAYLLRKHQSVWVYSILSAAFGLSFGALCSIPYFFIGGAKMAFTWWISGIPYDMIHCIGNFVLCLALFVPLRNALTKIKKYMITG